MKDKDFKDLLKSIDQAREPNMGKLKQKMVLRQDDSCHWYLIPYTSRERFDDLLESIEGGESGTDKYYDACEEFETIFNKYGIDGPQRVVITCYELEE